MIKVGLNYLGSASISLSTPVIDLIVLRYSKTLHIKAAIRLQPKPEAESYLDLIPHVRQVQLRLKIITKLSCQMICPTNPQYKLFDLTHKDIFALQSISSCTIRYSSGGWREAVSTSMDRALAIIHHRDHHQHCRATPTSSRTPS